MLSLKTFPHLHRPISFPNSSSLKSLFFSPKPSPPSSISFSTPTKSASSAAISSSMEETTIEHVVLFKVKESSDPTTMISQLRSLTSLGLTTHLTAAPVLRRVSSSLGFTHLLHSRYRSKADLATYGAHPDHVAVVKAHVLPISDDVMAVDWVSNSPALPPPPPGSAVRLTLAKPKEGSTASEILDVIGGAGSVEGILQLSYGENFSPARAKGYDVGMIAVFPGVEEMDRAAVGTEAAKEKVRPLLESIIVLDFLVPAPVDATASL